VNSSRQANPGGTGEAGTRGDLALPDFLRAQLPTLFPWSDEHISDGRLARGQRTRRSVADALIELLREGDPDPTAKAIAERAGVSLRLVFHHFADMDDLYHFVASLQFRQLWSGLPRLSPDLGLDRRIERTVAHRAGLFEDISAVRSALVRRSPTSEGVAAALHSSDALLLESLKATFATELEPLPTAMRTEVVQALDIATSWDAWDRMRRTAGLPVRTAKRVMARMLAALGTDPQLVPARLEAAAASA
jgi:AcrR family transcriptional regulator